MTAPRYITGIRLSASPQLSTRGVPQPPLHLRKDAWIEIREGRIHRMGGEAEPLPGGALPSEVYNADGALATPGLVDAHTHPVFAGTRQAEFARRCRGETYLQIAAAGGILSSMRGVREASEGQLAQLIQTRLNRFAAFGVTTIEAKSGYGLSVEAELKSLRALKRASESHPVEVSPTLLAAHVAPPEFRDRADDYVDIIIKELIPAVRAEGLAESVDVFVEEGAFSLSQAERIFEAGAGAGLRLRLHADQFHNGGGAELAARFGAASADHMDYTDDVGYRRLAEAGVVVVLLPGAVFFLGRDRYAPGRKMIDLGCSVALSTDYNPGSSPTPSLPLMMTLACLKMNLSPDEALWAATMGGALALQRERCIGSLEPGYQADIALWDVEDVASLPYNYGNIMPRAVFKKGELIVSDSNLKTNWYNVG